MELTSEHCRQLASASDLMLRPFEHATPLKYLVAASESIGPLVGAFASMCGTRTPEGTIGLDSAQWSVEDRDAFAQWKLRDPGTERALATQSDVITLRMVVGNDWEGYNRDPMVNQWYHPRNIRDMSAYLLHWAEDDALAMIELHFETLSSPSLAEQRQFLLTLLQPSFRGGMRLLYSVGQLREKVARDMDTLGVPLCVCSREGRIHHLSSAARLALADDPESARVIDRIPDIAGQVTLSKGRDTPGRRLPPGAVHQVVRTSRRRYRLSAALATHAMNFGRTDVLVTINALQSEVLAGDLASRYSLSPRECQVAALIGKGLSSVQIGRALGVSVHTVKRHTEHVYTKLGVRSRSTVAALIAALGRNQANP